jgi:hypothetical protein
MRSSSRTALPPADRPGAAGAWSAMIAQVNVGKQLEVRTIHLQTAKVVKTAIGPPTDFRIAPSLRGLAKVFDRRS